MVNKIFSYVIFTNDVKADGVKKEYFDVTIVLGDHIQSSESIDSPLTVARNTQVSVDTDNVLKIGDKEFQLTVDEGYIINNVDVTINSDQTITITVSAVYNVNINLADHVSGVLNNPYSIKENSLVSLSGNVLSVGDEDIQLTTDLGYKINSIDDVIISGAIDLDITTSPIEYKLTFLPGTYSIDPIEDINCLYDQSYTLPMPTYVTEVRDEEAKKIYTYTFNHWQNDLNEYLANDSVMNLTTEDGKVIEMTAKWDIESEDIPLVTYDVTITTDDKISGIESPYSVEENKTVSLSGNILSLGDKTITLTVTPGYKINSIDPVVVTNDTSIELTTSPISYVIEFNSGDGEGTMENIDMTYGLSVTLPAVAFTKADVEDLDNLKKYSYTFSKWQAADGTQYEDQTSVVNLTTEDGATVVLTAIWDEHVTDIVVYQPAYVGYIPFTNSEAITYTVDDTETEVTVLITDEQKSHMSTYAESLKTSGIVVPSLDLIDTSISKLNDNSIAGTIGQRNHIASECLKFVPETIDEAIKLPTITSIAVDTEYTIAESGNYIVAPLAFIIVDESKYKISKITTTNDPTTDIKDAKFTTSKSLDNNYVMYYEANWLALLSDSSWIITITNK